MSDEATVEVNRTQLATLLDYVRNDIQTYGDSIPDDVVEAHAHGEEQLGDTPEWTSVRRSEPAEYVAGIPDEATVWVCFTEDGPRSVTVYKSEAEGFAVVAHRDEEATVIAKGVGEDEAMETAEELKTDRATWAEHVA